MQPIVRLRLLRSNKSDVDLIEVRSVQTDQFVPVPTYFSTRGTQTVDLRLLKVDRTKSWMQVCQSGHDSCTGMKCQATSLPGFHLIDTAEKTIVHASLEMGFIALSYVWGSSTIMKARRFSKILSKDLPRTIQDAVDVTNAVGVRYLWVDALCIPQDDREIRSQQIGQMDKIYRSARAAIVAATGNNAEHGLQGLTRSKEVLKPAIWLNGELVTCTSLEEDLPAPASLSTWSTRGWTLQEGVLAQRRIIFTNDEIILDCGSNCLRETRFGVFEEDHRYLNELQNSHNNLENTMTLYEKLLYRYLQRNLSYDEDIIDAFQGISNYLAETSGTKCCWTLPRKRFLNGIT
jgi:Heterokaryon incompatibility protein (HET)